MTPDLSGGRQFSCSRNSDQTELGVVERCMRMGEVLDKERQTSQAAPRGFISSQVVWSRRSFIKAGVCSGGILLMNSGLTEELMAAQQTSSAGNKILTIQS